MIEPHPRDRSIIERELQAIPPGGTLYLPSYRIKVAFPKRVDEVETWAEQRQEFLHRCGELGLSVRYIDQHDLFKITNPTN